MSSMIIYSLTIVIFGYQLCDGGGNGDSEYQFEVETWKNFDDIFETGFLHPHHYLFSMDDADIIKLCTLAANHVGYDRPNSAKSEAIHKTIRFVTPKETIAMKCNSIPTIYVRYNVKNNKFAIMKESDPFSKSVFHFEHAKSAISCREMLRVDPKTFDLSDNQFSKLVESKCYVDSLLRDMEYREKTMLCHAAKQRAAVFGKINVKFEKSELGERPEIYKIVYPKREGERVVLKCPTTPPMMVHFRNLRENKDVQVIFFLPKSEEENE